MPPPDHQLSFNRAFVFLRRQNGFLVTMGSLWLLLSAYLIFADKPWDPALDFSASAKSTLRIHAYVVDGLWWGALINWFIVAFCLLASRFYPHSPPSNKTPAHDASPLHEWESLPIRQRKIILILSLLAIALSAGLRAPLLHHSLWGDEEATARRFIVGHVNRQDDGSLRLHTPRWEKTLWSFENGPNNHILYSVLGRLSHSFARPSTGPDNYYFSEFWIRLPSYLAGLGAVAAIAWLMVMMGFPRAAPVAAITLALHPWFVRWGTEARGYSLLLMFAPLLLVFLLKAIRADSDKKTWLWWLAYGLTEFLMIYAHLGSVYFLLPLNVAAFILVWRHSFISTRNYNPLAHPLFWQCTAANLFGAALTIQILTPILKPMNLWLGKSRTEGDITWPWVENWISYFASGMPWSAWDANNPYCITLPDFLSDHPLLTAPALLFILIALLTGFLALLKNPTQRYLLLPLLTPGLLTVLHAKLGGNLLYPWYMVGFLPLSIVVVSIGLDSLARFSPKRPAFIFIAAAFILLFAQLTQTQRQIYRTHPVEALAESVRMTRKVINPFAADIDEVITLDIVHATRLYDPAHLRIRSFEEFIAALKLADSTQRPLYINMANPGLLGRDLPKIDKIINNRNLFQHHKVIHGLQIPCTRYILRYIPHSFNRVSHSQTK